MAPLNKGHLVLHHTLISMDTSENKWHFAVPKVSVNQCSFPQQVKMKSMMAIGFTFTALLGMFNTLLVPIPSLPPFHLVSPVPIPPQIRRTRGGQTPLHSVLNPPEPVPPQPDGQRPDRLLLHLPLHTLHHVHQRSEAMM